MLSRRITPLTLLTALIVAVPAAADGPKTVTELQSGPKKLELDEADYYLRKFETYAERLKGEKGPLTADAKLALQKVSALRAQHPDHAKVEALYQRARSAAKKLQGVTLDITPAMLAYRQQAAKNAERLAEVSVAAWEDYRDRVAAQDGSILDALPAESPERKPLSEVRGSLVVLEGLRYPDDLFKHYARQFIAVGKPSVGFYFVDVSHRGFVGAYEAIRRYQRRVSDDIPAEWTVVGEIVSAQVMVPEAGEAKVGPAYAGWVVQPRAIYVPGKVFAVADDEHGEGGTFAGEDRMAEILADQYSIRSVPEDVTPEQLTGVFVTALKERNYDLYLDCIDPAERQTPTQREWLERKYDIFQRRLASDYAHVEVYQADPVRVIQGGEDAGDAQLLAEFVDEADLAAEAEHRLPRVEQQRLWLRLYDDTGKVREAPKALTLTRQEDVEGNRWFIYRGFPF